MSVVPVNGITSVWHGNSIEAVQKLFSMFPAGGPGVALLLLRLSVAAMLFVDCAGRISWLEPMWLELMSVAAAVAMTAGFLTPLIALACGALKIYALFGEAQSVTSLVVLALLLSLAVAMLGPGAYSLDAKMFGRRVVLLPPRR
jgi:hypothetical protein